MSDRQVTMSEGEFQAACNDAAEQAVDTFKSGVHQVYPDLSGDLQLPDDEEGTDGRGILCRIKRDGEGSDNGVGMSGWEEWCLDPDQKGTILAKLLASHAKLMRIKAHFDAPSDPCYCEGECRCRASDDASIRGFVQRILDEK